MKKSLIALAALAATSAFAQSAVTISGVLDAGYIYSKEVVTGGANGNVSRGNNNRINFSVAEDLGGGMRAIANVGMRFEPATGQPESSTRPIMQGETRVGLTGGFGTLLFGRGLSALQGPNGGFADPWGVTTVAGSVYAPGFATDYAAGGEGRIDTGIFYTAPTIGGLTLSGHFSPRKIITAGVASKTSMAANALYAGGPLAVGLGYEQNRAADTMTNLYGSYDLGAVKLHASYAIIEGGSSAEQAAAGTFGAAASAVQTANGATTVSGVYTTQARQVAAGGEIKTWTIGAMVPMGATSLRAGYSVWNGNGATGQKNDNKIGLGVRHSLSKRTYVYTDVATFTRKNNLGTVTSTLNGANTRQSQFDVGVAHSF